MLHGSHVSVKCYAGFAPSSPRSKIISLFLLRNFIFVSRGIGKCFALRVGFFSMPEVLNNVDLKFVNLKCTTQLVKKCLGFECKLSIMCFWFIAFRFHFANDLANMSAFSCINFN